MSEPILIGELMRQMGIVRPSQSPLKGEEWEVDRDLVCALFYYEQLSEERHQPIPDDLRRQLAEIHKL